MKTKEFKQAIKDMGLRLEEIQSGLGEKFYEIYVSGVVSARVSRELPGRLTTLPSFLHLSLSQRRRLLGAMMDYTETAIKDREEHRWNVIVGRNRFGEDSGVVAYFKRDDPLSFELSYAGSGKVLSNEWYVFSDKEFSNLITCLKREPDGGRMAKIAELGKTPAPEADE